jgi:2-polyprenyl-3-methyl-5-hydroxy-6-metoxy-1,4-benzoquinol methylase/Zn ribbon nucleic-acid-binding protein
MLSPPLAIARRCPLCNQDTPLPLWSKEDLKVVQCAQCSMVFASPVPEEFVSGTFYDQQSFYLSPNKLLSDYAPVRFERELRIFRKFCKTGRVLDVGCSTGAFLYQLKNRFSQEYEILGTDVAGKPLEHAESQGVPVNRTPFLDWAADSKGFDAVCFWAVLEHLAEPQRFLAKAAGLLKAGGYCFMLVPNLKSLAIRLLGPRYRYVMPDHLNYFDARTLAKLVLQSGSFEIVAVGTSHFNPAVLWDDWRRSSGARVTDNERARLLRQTTALKQSKLLWPIRMVYKGTEASLAAAGLADNLWLVARKISPNSY